MKSNKQPEVRFVEFNAEWHLRRLGEVVSIKTGKLDANAMKEDGPYDFYTSGVKKYKIDIPAFTGPAITIAGNGATVGFMHLADGEFNAYQRTYVLTDFQAKREFLYYEIGKKLPRKINQQARKGNIPYIVMDMLTDLNISLPSFEEQTKIGSFLKKIDETISLHQQELTTLKQTKQGFLQKMFPREGETVPEVRFPGFSSEWKELSLNEITDLITKGTTPISKSNKGEINFIKVENIDGHTGEISITSKVSKTEHEGYLKRSQLEPGDILFSIAGTLGRIAIIGEEVLPANTNQALAIIRLNEGDLYFISTFLKGKAVETYIRKNPTVGAQPNLSLKQVGDLTIILPEIQEQREIGRFFKYLDEVISFHQKELEALKETKKAFIQKMFV